VKDIENYLRHILNWEEIEMSKGPRAFAKSFYLNCVNKMVGSGGETLVKGAKNRGGSQNKIEIGDRLIGIGVTHFIENMEQTPGPNSFTLGPGPKMAARAFETVSKEEIDGGYSFLFSPLLPTDYSALLEEVSRGTARIPAESIPNGTMIISFIGKGGKGEQYTLRTIDGSPGANWTAVVSGSRQWNVGIGKETDFWAANFPSDDVEYLSDIATWSVVGRIRFGLSLLAGSDSTTKFAPVPCIHPSGRETYHDFCLAGNVVGTRGLVTPFPIGLRTEIICKPVS